MRREVVSLAERLNIDTQAASRLQSLLRMDRTGYPIDLVSPMLLREGSQEEHDSQRYLLADGLLAQMVSALDNDRLAYLWDLELRQRDRIGSYSIMVPFEDRYDGLEKYYAPKKTNIDPDLLEKAILLVKAELPPHSLRATTLNAAFNIMPKGTNLGFPFISKSKEFYPFLLQIAQRALDSRFDDAREDPCLHFWRGQPRGRGELPKQRHVWGFPHWVTLLEEMIQVPLLDALTAADPVSYSAWIGLDSVDSAASILLDNAHVPILSLDFSGYDASLPPELIRGAFDCIRYWFKDSDKGLIDFVEYNNLYIPIVTPFGTLTGVHGEPSGSGVTNTIDTLAQRISIQYIALRVGLKVLYHLAQGDDGGVLFSGDWDIEEISHYATDLNLTLSSDKGGVSQSEVYYLQNVYSTKLTSSDGRKYLRYRSLMKVINGMMSYERLKDTDLWNGYMDTLRWFQQCETASQNQNFSLLVDFLWSNDRISRQFGPREIIARAGGMERAKSLLNERAFPYGKESLNGLMGYQVVSLLNEKRSRRK